MCRENKPLRSIGIPNPTYQSDFILDGLVQAGDVIRYEFLCFQNETTIPRPFAIIIKSGGYDVTIDTPAPVHPLTLRAALRLVWQNELARHAWSIPNRFADDREAELSNHE